jgi:2-iminoacetate synthase ThiH
MLTEFTASLRGIAARIYLKFVQNIQARSLKKERTELQAALMLGSIRRIK